MIKLPQKVKTYSYELYNSNLFACRVVQTRNKFDTTPCCRIKISGYNGGRFYKKPINCLWAGQRFTDMIVDIALSLISSFLYDFFVKNKNLGGKKMLILTIFIGLVLGEEQIAMVIQSPPKIIGSGLEYIWE